LFNLRRLDQIKSNSNFQNLAKLLLDPKSKQSTFLFFILCEGKDFGCIYSFLEDKFYNSGYFFIGKHTNKNLHIDDYEMY